MTEKIAICVPSGSYWNAEMALSLIDIARTTPFELAVLNLMGSQISLQRNELVKLALKTGATYLYWQDSDMTAPPTTIMELMCHNKDIVGATYIKRVPPHKMLGKLQHADGRLKPATMMPGGCMLVRASVYETMGWPWYFETVMEQTEENPCGMRGEDYGFCHKAGEHGFKLWCDINLSQRLSHIGTRPYRMQPVDGHPDRVEQE
jgi:hypothetical protein